MHNFTVFREPDPNDRKKPKPGQVVTTPEPPKLEVNTEPPTTDDDDQAETKRTEEPPSQQP